MSEQGELPKDIVRTDKQNPSIWSKLRTVKNVAFNRDYDASVDPAAYEAYVTKIGRRPEHGKLLSDLLGRYIPTIDSEGKQAKVLDIAAGTGIISRSLVEKGYDVTATDLSQNALNYLQSQSEDISVQQADMNQGLPFEDNSYDGVTSVWANRYLRDTDSFLRDIHRVLKPGGVFVWPIFPSERPFWMMRNGIKQHTTSGRLRDDAIRLGFTEAGIVKMSVKEARQKDIPLHTLPRYIIAKK